MRDLLARTERASRSYRVDGTLINAVIDADLSIEPAARIALMGPSGSGKTTLLAGLDAPTSGLVEWPALGDREGLRPSKIAISFQGPSLLPALDVAENVALPLLLGGMSEPDAASAAATMLERMDLSDLARKVPDELSGGQSQRVGLARALAARGRFRVRLRRADRDPRRRGRRTPGDPVDDERRRPVDGRRLTC
jgi:ABC-type lipoprotein export system ATPase subunit